MYLAGVFDEPRNILWCEMEYNPAIDPGDEISRPQVGHAGRGVVPHTGHTHPQPSLPSPGLDS